LANNQTHKLFFDITQKNKEYLKQWLGWLDDDRTVTDSEKYITDSNKKIF